MFKTSLQNGIRALCAQDKQFYRIHRVIQFMMAFWAISIAADRMIGIATSAYEQISIIVPLAGAVLLLLIAFLGTRGHLTLALVFLEINMAVFLLQFVSSCFFYRETVVLWKVLFYGVAAAGLIAISLVLFLSRNIETYREKIRELSGKGEKEPYFYRTNRKLVRNIKK